MREEEQEEEEEEEETASKFVADNEMGERTEARLNWQITIEVHSRPLFERMDNWPPQDHREIPQALHGLA